MVSKTVYNTCITLTQINLIILFAYFTQIIYYAFIRRIQKEKKQTHIKHKMIEKEEYKTYETLPGDTNSYNIQGFDYGNVARYPCI